MGTQIKQSSQTIYSIHVYQEPNDIPNIYIKEILQNVLQFLAKRGDGNHQICGESGWLKVKGGPQIKATLIWKFSTKIIFFCGQWRP